MDAKEETAQLTAISSPSQSISYADRDVRISKENLYMVLALHMETFPVEREEEIGDYHKVGAVLVLPNDMIYAVDCSRNGVHGAARLLMPTKVSCTIAKFSCRENHAPCVQSFWFSLK